MLIRLLVVLLTLVGPMPFRVCTCAASVPAQTPAAATTPENPVAVKTCRCGHTAPPKGTAPAGDARAHAAGCDGSHPNPHDRDCPAANPRPLVRDAGPLTVIETPTDGGASQSMVRVEFLPLARSQVACRPASPHSLKLPLYITFLALRN